MIVPLGMVCHLLWQILAKHCHHRCLKRDLKDHACNRIITSINNVNDLWSILKSSDVPVSHTPKCFDHCRIELTALSSEVLTGAACMEFGWSSSEWSLVEKSGTLEPGLDYDVCQWLQCAAKVNIQRTIIYYKYLSELLDQTESKGETEYKGGNWFLSEHVAGQ